jgi:hypothetical protein
MDTGPEITTQRKYVVETYKDFLKDKLFLEFGVFVGTSILEYYNLYLDNQSADYTPQFYGFDSFEGLPEEKNDSKSPWHTGQFNLNKNINPELLNKPGMKIVDGWFNETLNQSLANELKGKKIGLLHIDCDIYTSTMQVYEFLIANDLLTEGTVVVYDDWGVYRELGLSEEEQYLHGEGKAHKEISEKYGLNFELIRKDVICPVLYEIATFVLKNTPSHKVT